MYDELESSHKKGYDELESSHKKGYDELESIISKIEFQFFLIDCLIIFPFFYPFYSRSQNKEYKISFGIRSSPSPISELLFGRGS